MLTFVEIIKNLYLKGKIDADKIYEFLEKQKISREEYLKILGEEEANE